MGPINRILETAHREVQQFTDSVADSRQTISPTQAEKFIKTIQSKSDVLQKAAKGDFKAKADTLDTKSLDRLAKAIVSLGSNSAIARQFAKPSQYANLGNVLLSLGETVEKMRRKKQEVLIKKKGLKVEKYEIIEFLNATEKDFERFVVSIKDRGADEDMLLQFIKELIRRMEILKFLNKISLKKKAKRLVDSKHYKKLLKWIKKISQDELIKKKIYEIGIHGESGNSHLRFWKTLKQLSDILHELSSS